MYKNELKETYKSVYENLREIDKILVEIKTDLHTIEKLAPSQKNEEIVANIYKRLEKVGIELYATKNNVIDMYKN